MEKFISYEKLSKKKQREINKQKRGSWNGINPVTRMVPNSKAYNRKKVQKQFLEEFDSVPFIYLKLARIPLLQIIAMIKWRMNGS